MPVVRDIPLILKTKDVLRWEGFREYSKIRPEIESLILELLASVEETHLLKPAAVYEIYPVAGMSRQPLPPAAIPPGAEELGVVVGTIGPGLEEQVTASFKRGEPLRGVLLDGIGSAAVDLLTGEVCRLMANEASARGYQTGGFASPGMPGFPLAEQRRLFELVPAHEIGVSLTRAGVMVPRKSASMLIGLGPQMKKETTAALCTRCRLKKTCHYRAHAPAEGRAGRK